MFYCIMYIMYQKTGGPVRMTAKMLTVKCLSYEVLQCDDHKLWLTFGIS